MVVQIDRHCAYRPAQENKRVIDFYLRTLIKYSEQGNDKKILVLVIDKLLIENNNNTSKSKQK